MIDSKELFDFTVFSGMSTDIISRIAQHCEWSEPDAGQMIFREGDTADRIYGVVGGEIELSLLFRDKVLKTDIQYEEAIRTHIETLEKRIIVDTVGPRELMGWSALIGPKIYTSTASAAEPSRLFHIEADRMRSILKSDAEAGFLFLEKLAEVISKRLRNRTESLLESWAETFGADRI